MADNSKPLFLPVSLTPDGAVVVSYKDLKANPLLLTPSIERAFGSDPQSLGIIIVRNLPEVYIAYRERLLKLAHKFANLPPEVREKCVHAPSKYSFGWSHGKEIMNGKPDLLKGSYYANPVVDKPSVPKSEQIRFPEYYGANIWPSQGDIDGFQEAFKTLGKFVFDVGLDLAEACQPFALSHLPDSTVSLPQLIATSQTTKARLLHYFPPKEGQLPSEDEPIDSWCGFHLDHSLLTGLCSAIFLRKDGEGKLVAVPSPSPQAGLYIKTRGGALTKVSIPADCLAFQTGEALEIATGGKLLATPHCVRVVSGEGSKEISRETFVVFMQPNTDQKLVEDLTFGEFSKKVLDEHYGPEAGM